MVLDEAFIDEARNSLPELPDARKARFMDQYGLNDYDAGLLAADARLAAFFEETAQHGKDAKLSANWILGELSARLNAEERSVNDSPVSGIQLGALVTRIADNTISQQVPRKSSRRSGKATAATSIPLLMPRG